MVCKFSELKNKEIVNVSTGAKLGNVADLEIDTQNCVITSLIVAEKPKKGFGGLMQKSNESVIPFANIKLIGDDTILVEFEQAEETPAGEGLEETDFEKSEETIDNQ